MYFELAWLQLGLKHFVPDCHFDHTPEDKDNDLLYSFFRKSLRQFKLLFGKRSSYLNVNINFLFY